MANYEHGDTATFYFVIRPIKGAMTVKAFSDRKEILKIYMDFHKCKDYKVKKVTNTIDFINNIINENFNDEIAIGNIYMRNPKNPNEVKLVSIPLTDTEFGFIRDESEDYMSTRVNYHYMSGVIPYLKNKYQSALHDIFLNSIIDKVLNNKVDKYNRQIELDQLMIFFRSFPDEFGK